MSDRAERMVEVYAARNALEAYFLTDLLAGAGIEARVIGDNSPYAGVIGVSSPRIWVFENDHAAAQQLLRDYEARRQDQPGDDILQL